LNWRSADATNYKAQRDAQRYISLFKQAVVAQDQYDQYTSIARVDAAKVDSAREAAESNLKTIAARAADADVAKAALGQALTFLEQDSNFVSIRGWPIIQVDHRFAPFSASLRDWV
jgi:hypothetical protein